MVLRIKEREEAIQILAMDPQVYGKIFTLHRKGNRVDVDALHDRIPLWQDAGKAPRWDLTEQKVAAVEKCFRGCFWWFGNICEYIGERIRPGGSRGARKAGSAPYPLGTPSVLLAASWLLRLHLQVSWLSSGPRKIIAKVLFCLVFLSCEAQKQGKKQELALVCRLIGQSPK